MAAHCNNCGFEAEEMLWEECDRCGSPDIEFQSIVPLEGRDEMTRTEVQSPDYVPDPITANRIGNIHLVSNQETLFCSYPTATIQDVKDFLVKCITEGQGEVEVDTETEGLFDHVNKVKILQLGNRFLDIQYVIDAESIDIREFKEGLEDARLLKLFHNASFDLKFLRLYEIYIRRVYDTFLGECVLTTGYKTDKGDKTGEDDDYHVQTRDGYVKVELSLGGLVFRHFGHKMNKDIRGNINKMGLVDSVIQYSGEDVMFLGKLREEQLKKLTEWDLLRTIELENLFVVVLSKIEFHGFRLDKEKWLALSVQFNESKRKAIQALNDFVKNDAVLAKNFVSPQLNMFEESGLLVDWGSPKSVIKLFKFLGMNTKTVDKKTKKLKDTCEAKHVKKFKALFPIITPYLHYKEQEKLCSTYGKDFLKHVNKKTGRVHSDFWQIINTGRISSRDPNLQNIPSRSEFAPMLRACFIAEPGNVLHVSDYSSQEPRVTADLCQDPILIDFFLNGDGDIHSLVASKMFSVIRGQEVVINKANAKDHKKERDAGKILGLKMDYGGSAYTIKDELGVSQAEAEVFVKAYDEGFPEKKKYFDRKIAETLKQGYVLIDKVTKRRSWLPKWERWKELEGKLTEMKEEMGRAFYEILSAESKVYKALKAKHGESQFFFHYQNREYANLYLWNREAFILKGEMERAAKNFPIQGTSGSMTKLAAIRIDREFVARGFSDIEGTGGWDNAKMVNLVHDKRICCGKTLLIAGNS